MSDRKHRSFLISELCRRGRRGFSWVNHYSSDGTWILHVHRLEIVTASLLLPLSLTCLPSSAQLASLATLPPADRQLREPALLSKKNTVEAWLTREANTLQKYRLVRHTCTYLFRSCVCVCVSMCKLHSIKIKLTRPHCGMRSYHCSASAVARLHPSLNWALVLILNCTENLGQLIKSLHRQTYKHLAKRLKPTLW